MAKKYMTMDGNTAAAYTSYAFTEVAGIYPITPSSPMADYVDQWSQQDRKNIFGQAVDVVEMQSEGGAAGVVHGSLTSGALTTTYTASQGLLLMVPNMYKIAGELLPCVFHVSARAIATHALSIFGDHSDVMACRQTGFALLASSGVQEATDLAAVAHLATIKGRVPFVHFFDGFRTSHEIQKIEVQDYADYAALIDFDAVEAFRNRSLSPNHPTLRGTAQNPDIFFQARESANKYYEAIPEIVADYMDKISALTGRDYKLFNYYGAADADRVIIAMGSVCDTVGEVVDFLNARGEKVGLLNVHLYRPFSSKHMLEQLPQTVKKIAVLDRTKEPGSEGEPLFLDVIAAFRGNKNAPEIIGGRYGLGSKDTTPDQVLTVYKELNKAEPKQEFTIGIVDDITHLSLPIEETIDVAKKGTVAARFWGLGSDGTVGANKNSIKIIGDHTDMYAQAYFSYDSKKSGGITISDLRFGKSPIHSPYLINKADFVACHNQSYVFSYDMMATLKAGGKFLLNTHWTEAELEEHLPAEMKQYIAKNNIDFYTIDAVKLGDEIGLGSRVNTICQSAFFKIVEIIPVEEAVEYMKAAAKKSYSKKGDDIVKMNYKAIEAGVENVQKITVPETWAAATENAKVKKDIPDFAKNVAAVMNRMEGDKLPVSTFIDVEDGTFPQGSTQYEKRGIAVSIPIWAEDNCIQCNQCSFVCPHAVIRPFLLTKDEAETAPTEFATKAGLKPYADYQYRIQVSADDCTGCGSCAQVCPAKEKALVMQPREDNLIQVANWDYAIRLARKENPMGVTSVKGSQFEKPLFEFSGACAGCGETPYVKLVSQLFGDRMQIANATGCSSIYSGSAPSQPYTVNDQGHGPSWANSLFEDNAEYGLGMHIGARQIRNRAKEKVEKLLSMDTSEAITQSGQAWLEEYHKGDTARKTSDQLIEALKTYQGTTAEVQKLVAEVMYIQDYLVKRSTWIIGGDGWAYDIGYGGLDHVLSTGEDVNILVLDTEVYSNTGGQSSKATNLGAIAQFAAGGKSVKKKDLGMMAMSYGYVYVAQIAMGANQTQTLKVLAEAEAYHGPSLVIAYSPCINHGIRGGLTVSQAREKEAVECGYWHLYRFNPELEKIGKNPFKLESREPKGDFKAFLDAEIRYSSLRKKFSPEKVDEIYNRCHLTAIDRYNSYMRLQSYDYSKNIVLPDNKTVSGI